eukprot:scaffold587539_cov27-Prasinocladus_malaysianus.AAC.1
MHGSELVRGNYGCDRQTPRWLAGLAKGTLVMGSRNSSTTGTDIIKALTGCKWEPLPEVRDYSRVFIDKYRKENNLNQKPAFVLLNQAFEVQNHMRKCDKKVQLSSMIKTIKKPVFLLLLVV